MSSQNSDHYIAQLGEKLERARLSQNISQANLAQQAGISARTLRRFESGEGGTLDSFIRLLMALKLDGNLDVLIPDSTIRPMERTGKTKSERLRASRANKKTNNAQRETLASHNQGTSASRGEPRWKWGDEQS